jgi:hypothetical protein
MNRNFIILLLIIFVIGVLYYYIKKERFIDANNCLDLSFNTDDKSKPFNQIFSKIYINNTTFNDPKKFMTFMNQDFNELHQKAIASFLGLRDGINMKSTQDYQHFVVKHKILVSFDSNIDKYLEINFNNFQNNAQFIKIIYNHTNMKCVVENSLPESTDSEIIVPRTTMEPSEIILSNGFGNTIEFVMTTIRRTGVIYNQFSFFINGNMYCYNLPNGIENHFYNGLRNITIYSSNTNSNNSFTIRHTCNGEIYSSYAARKIDWIRVPKNAGYYDTRAVIRDIPNSWGGFHLVIPNMGTFPGYLPIGAYMIRGYNTTDPNLMTNPAFESALILKEGDYVIPGTKYWNTWDNGRNYGSGWAEYPRWDELAEDGTKYIFMNSSIETKNVNGTDYAFKGLGGDAITVMKGTQWGKDKIAERKYNKENYSHKWWANTGIFGDDWATGPDNGSFINYAGLSYDIIQAENDNYLGFRRYQENPQPYKPLALIREDCLEEHTASSGAQALWWSTGTTTREGSVWTYNNEAINKEGSAGYPGDWLTVFNVGSGAPEPQKKLKIKDTCLFPQPQLLTNDEKINIDAIVVDRTNTYLDNLKTLKTTKDSVINPNINLIKTENTLKITNLNQSINNSKSIYDSDYNANMNVNAVQDKYNNRYDFMNLLSDKLTPLKATERTLYNNQKPKLNTISSAIDTSLYEQVNLLKEANKNFISKSSNTSDLVKQYNLQRDNDKILRFIGQQVSK